MGVDFPFWRDFVQFCQKVVQTPSLSGEEGKVAQLIKEKMEQLRFDEVLIDRVGNVIGLLRGDPRKSSICFTTHMDHVDPGNESEWQYPPYAGTIADAYLHGRGTSDSKVALATHVYIPEILRQIKVEHGDIYVVGVVLEEKGGIGSKYLDSTVKESIDYAINGEPTSNRVKIGDKGRVELEVNFKGKTTHAATPELGINPFYDMATFIMNLKSLKMAKDEYGISTAEPTLCFTDPQCSNTIPERCTLTVDWRNIPGESEDQVIDKIRGLLPRNGEVSIPEYQLKTYTGFDYIIKRSKMPFSIERDHPFVKETVKAVRSILKREVEVSRWPFITDCRFFSEAGIPILGFSPGEEKSAHTNHERIGLHLMEEAMECYPGIISSVSKLKRRKDRAGENL